MRITLDPEVQAILDRIAAALEALAVERQTAPPPPAPPPQKFLGDTE